VFLAVSQEELICAQSNVRRVWVLYLKTKEELEGLGSDSCSAAILHGFRENLSCNQEPKVNITDDPYCFFSLCFIKK